MELDTTIERRTNKLLSKRKEIPTSRRWKKQETGQREQAEGATKKKQRPVNINAKQICNYVNLVLSVVELLLLKRTCNRQSRRMTIHFIYFPSLQFIPVTSSHPTSSLVTFL